MNTRYICLLGIVGFFAGAASAGELQTASVDAKPTAAASESADVQHIRGRLAESCARNPDCAASARDRGTLKSRTAYEPPSAALSTIERRRALGLKDGPARSP